MQNIKKGPIPNSRVFEPLLIYIYQRILAVLGLLSRRVGGSRQLSNLFENANRWEPLYRLRHRRKSICSRMSLESK